MDIQTPEFNHSPKILPSYVSGRIILPPGQPKTTRSMQVNLSNMVIIPFKVIPTNIQWPVGNFLGRYDDPMLGKLVMPQFPKSMPVVRGIRED